MFGGYMLATHAEDQVSRLYVIDAGVVHVLAVWSAQRGYPPKLVWPPVGSMS
jgi:hypothetical protein